MEYSVLMALITGIAGKVAEWLRTAAEIREAEDAGGPVSPELREKARKAGIAAQAVMHAAKAPE